MKIKNPILSGFYPDPSICKDDEYFYLVTSTFTYFPGVPIFRSKDLSNWEQIGNVLDRKSQLDLSNTRHSEGIFAPTIRYNDGTYYMITTNITHGGNFIVTSKDPAGPWSDPNFLEGAQGIDPSLFFDNDGKVYYVGTRPNQQGVRYNGDWEVWTQELDLNSMKLVGESHKIWKGALKNVIWPEGPHIYKKGNYYYLMIAEGGTGPDHCITVARSTSVFGEYVGNPKNPIITHRHLGNKYPIQHVGHGDLISTQDNKWFIIMLASRKFNGYCNIGRETFLATVDWEEDWPIINYGVGILQEEQEVDLCEYPVERKTNSYHFYKEQIEKEWLFLKNPSENLYSLKEREGALRLYLKEQTLSDLDNPAYIALRQKSYNYIASTAMDFTPNSQNECAGIAVVQSNEYYMTYEYTKKEEKYVLRIIEKNKEKSIILNEVEIKNKRLYLKIQCKDSLLTFYYGYDGINYEVLQRDVDTRNLSTEVAGGFVGCTLGMYGSSNRYKSNNYADFLCFEYQDIK